VPVNVLGISAFYHDSAAALVRDGEIVAAAQEERFTRVKGDAEFPHHAIGWCLSAAGIGEAELDHVAYYEDPAVKLERLLMTAHVVAPLGLGSFLRSMPSWLTRKAWTGHLAAKDMGLDREVLLGDHHLSHAASAFYPSPFEEAAILTVDGAGEWSTATVGVGRGRRVELLEEIRFPNSLGLLYSAFTGYCGFRVNSGEYKLMGLAPFGRPRFAKAIRESLAHVAEDGSVVLNQRYFDYLGGSRMTNARFHELLGGPPREPESPIEERHADVAASIQSVLDDAVVAMARHAHAVTGLPDLVMAGGVALNVVSSGAVLRRGPFARLWIQPAAGDAGGALGVALWAWHEVLGNERTPLATDSMKGAFLGPDVAPASADDDAMLRRLGASWEAMDDGPLQDRIAAELEAGRVVAIARGRMELGPRALGARSILADARSPGMQSRLNLKVKFRETFRPFAPMVLAEDAREWFDAPCESPYMLLAFPVAAGRMRPVDDAGLAGLERLAAVRSEIPAVTHVDGSARVQTVDAARNPFVHGVLERFKARTGCPVVVNTSFNVRGEPIVATPDDALACFARTAIDALVIGPFVVHRELQSERSLATAATALVGTD
jgi:carbamoyltransferase